MHIIITPPPTPPLIQKHLNIPLLDIPLSPYHFLPPLTLIKHYQPKKPLLPFQNITQALPTIADLYPIKIHIYT
ncbi:PrpR N-terminal domain-containing protein, partial [Bacillus altitudinis]|uniref:PrpR N-terminal domain-containing protein n=1 Tax=Bacillus altitudinis TaxID=293387 RepID=UPI003B516E1B